MYDILKTSKVIILGEKVKNTTWAPKMGILKLLLGNASLPGLEIKLGQVRHIKNEQQTTETDQNYFQKNEEVNFK